jgi:hypothetical protein
MNKKIQVLVTSAMIAASFAGCAKVGQNQTAANPTNTLPTVLGSSGNYLVKAKAEFDVTRSGQAGAKLEMKLVKMSYASGGACAHGSCVDYSDITVTNTINTQFAITQNGFTSANTELLTQQNTVISNLGVFQIATGMFDNDLFACGAPSTQNPSGTHCTAAVIRAYTTSVNAGSGLYNSVNGQSIPLLISSQITGQGDTAPFTSVPIGYGQSNAVILEQLTLPAGQQVITLANWINPQYTLGANFQAAGSGTYHAHLVIEYALANSGGFYSAPNTNLAGLPYYNSPGFQIASGGIPMGAGTPIGGNNEGNSATAALGPIFQNVAITPLSLVSTATYPWAVKQTDGSTISLFFGMSSAQQ